MLFDSGKRGLRAQGRVWIRSVARRCDLFCKPDCRFREFRLEITGIWYPLEHGARFDAYSPSGRQPSQFPDLKRGALYCGGESRLRS